MIHCYQGDNTACLKRGCNTTTGVCQVTHAENGAPCDWDSNGCTLDSCHNGACKPGTGKPAATGACDCVSDSDCAGFDDGNVCTGTVYCSLASNRCVHNPSTVIKCPHVNDTACSRNECQPQTGACAMQAKPEAAPCDDDVPCTTAESCKGGKCTSETFSCGCATNADCAKVDDEDMCNAALYCDKVSGSCKANAASTVLCPEKPTKPCLANKCQPKTGKCAVVAADETQPCEADGSPCTVTDRCVSGICKAGPNVCECEEDADCALFSDLGVCAGTPYCDKAKHLCKLNAKDAVICTGEGTACRPDTCDPKTGECAPANAPPGTACDDGSACTNGDLCNLGACAPGDKVDCDDNSACTSDSCAAETGCTHTPQSVGKTVACYSGPPHLADVGACKSGSGECQANGAVDSCAGEVLPKGVDDCGGVDDDCDGVTDEDCFKAKIVVTCGTGQAGQPGGALAGQLTVKVTDPGNNPLSGRTVFWAAPLGGALVSSSTKTNGAGITTNRFTLGDTDNFNYAVHATVEGSSATTKAFFKASTTAPPYVLSYPSFCDTSGLKTTGVATFEGNKARIVTGGDGQNGSMWFTKPLAKNTSFEMYADISGFTAGYSVVLQSTTNGTSLPAGGYGDKDTLKRKNAVVVQISGGKGGGQVGAAKLEVAANGQVVKTLGSFLPSNTNQLPRRIWLNYDHDTTTLRVYAGAAGGQKPASPNTSVKSNVWGFLGANGQPTYAGFTAGNASAGVNGNKYVDRWALYYQAP